MSFVHFEEKNPREKKKEKERKEKVKEKERKKRNQARREAGRQEREKEKLKLRTKKEEPLPSTIVSHQSSHRRHCRQFRTVSSPDLVLRVDSYSDLKNSF